MNCPKCGATLTTGECTRIQTWRIPSGGRHVEPYSSIDFFRPDDMAEQYPESDVGLRCPNGCYEEPGKNSL